MDLGAFGRELTLTQGHALEMSFKANLCAQGLYECPCSRIAHLYPYKKPENETKDSIKRSLKRIAEVWMVRKKNLM